MHAVEIDALYRRHARGLMAHCAGLLGSASAARDVVHDAFERILRQEPALQVQAVAYLYRTCTNLCLDVLRHRKVRRRMDPQLGELDAAFGTREPAHTDRQHARVLLDRVGPRTATVGVLHFVYGMNQGEVAAAVGLSRRSVFQHLTRLRAYASEPDVDTLRCDQTLDESA